METHVSKPPDLIGQTAVVTGAAGGIGKATCRALAREGADIVASDIEDSDLEAVASEVEAQGQSCEVVYCDVSSSEDVQYLYNRTFEEFETVEIIVTVHGILSENSPLGDFAREDWEGILDVNLTGTFLIVQAFYDHLLDNNYGKIVCIGSLAGEVGGVLSGPDYVASKGGIHAFVKWLAEDGGERNVYANAIAPGAIWTPMTEGKDYSSELSSLNRLGQPEDIAEGIVFLSSQQSNWITGTVLNINGGMRKD
jgi:NAD(P)-dependent dehydrogenase (short-subunit alcohol dehydrogenase family)